MKKVNKIEKSLDKRLFSSLIILEIIAIVAIIIFDQATKVLAYENLAAFEGESFSFIPGFVNFTFVNNTGAAFGMFSNVTWLLAILSTVFGVIMIVILMKTNRFDSIMLKISLTFIIGGAIGNVIDRIFLGAVRDMIEFAFVDFAIFNAADSFVCIGAVILGIFVIFKSEKYFGNKKIEKNVNESD